MFLVGHKPTIYILNYEGYEGYLSSFLCCICYSQI